MRIFKSFSHVVVVIGCLLFGQKAVSATGPEWSKPYLLFETQGAVYMTDLAADPAGNVHAVWSSKADNAIFYAVRSSANETWSRPIDVIYNSDPPRFPNLIFGSDGQLHLFAVASCLMHAAVPVDPFPLSARAWDQTRKCIAGMSLEFGATADKNGNLHVAYTDVPPKYVYYQTSSDGGQTWSGQRTVWYAGENTYVNCVRLAISDDGTAHVVWTDYPVPAAWPPQGVYYSQSRDKGNNWSAPFELAGSNYLEPRIVSFGNQLHAVINGAAAIGSRYHRYSLDGGRTWSGLKTAVQGSAGMLGAPAAVFDSLGRLHAVVGTNEGVQYSMWNGTLWSPAQTVFLPKVDPKEDTGHPSVVITHGNQLHVIYRDIDRRIYYSTRTIDAPKKPSMALPPHITRTPTSVLNVTSFLKATPAPVSSNVGNFDRTFESDSNVPSIHPLLVSAALSLAAIALAVFASGVGRRPR